MYLRETLFTNIEVKDKKLVIEAELYNPWYGEDEGIIFTGNWSKRLSMHFLINMKGSHAFNLAMSGVGAMMKVIFFHMFLNRKLAMHWDFWTH